MPTMYDNAVPIVNLPFFYINGAVVASNATTTRVDVAAGIMRDSTNTYDMNIGNFNGQVNPNATVNVTTTINAAVNGLNGLDTGALAASKVYYIYVVSDPVSGLPSGAMASLGLPTVGPLMPFGYSAFRHVGYAVTSAGAVFLKAYTAGNQNARIFMYDAPISVGTTASSASYAAINLITFVPLVNNLPVYLNYTFTGTAGDTLALQPGAATGDAFVMAAQVNAVAQQGQAMVLAQNTVISTVNSPTINYKNSGTDTITIRCAGFNYYI